MTPDDLEPMSADLTSLLDAEKPITAAPAGAKAKLLARLSADLFDGPGGDGGGEGSDGGAGGAAPSTPAGGGVGASAGTGVVGATASGVVAKAVVAKLVVGASVASLAVGGVIGAGVHSAVTTPPPPPPPIVRLAPVEPAPVAVPPPAPPPVVEAVPPVVEPRPAQPPGSKLSADEQLALEKSYVEQARAAMARKDVDAALDALAQHERRFPKGQLTEERLALKVMALSSAGRSIEAKNVAAEFRRRFPTGLFRAAVDDASPE